VAVSATGTRHIRHQHENIAYLTLFFDSDLLAHVHVSWSAPVKLRRTLIGGSKKMLVYNDLLPDENIRIYDSGVDLEDDDSKYRTKVSYRTGDILIPRIEQKEALATEIAHFIACIEGNLSPITDGHAGYRAVKIIEAASRSMQNNGSPEEI
jgi:predicted dehydrogenase